MSLFFHRSSTTTTKTKPIIMKTGLHPSLPSLHHKEDTVSSVPHRTTTSSSLSSSSSSEPRIPISLQQVFLQSNRGEDVHVPPPKRIASRIFRTLTNFRGRGARRPKNLNHRRNHQQHPISIPTTNTTMDHTMTTNCSSSSSNSTDSSNGSHSVHGDDNDDDPTIIVEVNHTTSNSSSKQQQQYQDIVVIHPSTMTTTTTTIQKEISLTVTPLSYVDAILQSRGYSTTKYNALQTAYYNRPTPYQQLCYDTNILKLIKQTEHDDPCTRRKNIYALQQLFRAGISSNPCNAHGESLLHTICRLGTGYDDDDDHHHHKASSSLSKSSSSLSWSYELLQVMISSSSSSMGKYDIITNCVDDYGRTPLHDACWCHHICYKSIALLLQHDPTLILLQDCRGATPLSYIPVQHHTSFMEFMTQHKDQFFPDIRSTSRDSIVTIPSKLVHLPPNRRPLPDPKNALSPDVAKMVVSGRITPQELTFLLLQDHADDEEDDDDDDDDESESSYDDDEDDDDEDDDSSTIQSGEVDGFLPPKKINNVRSNAARHTISDEIGSDDDDESYSDLDEMLKQLQSLNHPQNNNNKNDEAVLGIGRPQYGYEMMNNKSPSKRDSKVADRIYDKDDINHDEMDGEYNTTPDHVMKPMSSVHIPTIHCSNTDMVDTTLPSPRSLIPTSMLSSSSHLNGSNSTNIKLQLLNNQHHPIMDALTTNELLEFSV